MNMQKYIPEYEKLTGKKLDPKVIKIIEKLDDCGKQFKSRGREDASRGRPAAHEEVFRSWGDKVFDDDPEMAEVMSDLMQECYMEGYREGGAADGR